MAAQINSPDLPPPAHSVDDLYLRYRTELRRLLARRIRREDLDDIIQEVFLNLVRRRPPATELRSPLGFLLVVAFNTIRDINRRKARAPQDVPFDRAPHGLWLADDATSLAHQDDLNRLLHELPRVVQVAIVRQHRDGWTYQRIAAELGCTTHAVKKYISRGLCHFRRHFAAEPTSGVDA